MDTLAKSVDAHISSSVMSIIVHTFKGQYQLQQHTLK